MPKYRFLLWSISRNYDETSRSDDVDLGDFWKELAGLTIGSGSWRGLWGTPNLKGASDLKQQVGLWSWKWWHSCWKKINTSPCQDPALKWGRCASHRRQDLHGHEKPRSSGHGLMRMNFLDQFGDEMKLSFLVYKRYLVMAYQEAVCALSTQQFFGRKNLSLCKKATST